MISKLLLLSLLTGVKNKNRQSPPGPKCTKIAEVKAVVVEGNQHEKSDSYDIEIKYPKVMVPDKDISKMINDDITKDVFAFRDQLMEDAKKDYELSKVGEGFIMQPYKGYIDYAVHDQTNILSITILYYMDTGGAHGNSVMKPYNYDLRTGEKLALKDLFVEGYDYTSVINEEIKKQIDAKPEYYYHDKYGFQSVDEEQYFYLTGEELVIYFNPYDIAPFSTGIPTFTIPYTVFGDKIKSSIVC